VPPPTAHSVDFAPPSVVYERIWLFLANQPVPANFQPSLPEATTRAWAGDTAIAFLDSLDVPSAAGLNRFVSNWWPGTPNAEFWASWFSRRQTLADLLETNVLLSNGSGLLTDPAVLHLSSISERGAFLSSQLLCQLIPPPPPVMPPAPPADGGTRRQQLAVAVDSPACVACHRSMDMDPLGISLEHFAPDGTFLDLDNGQPIDSSAVLNSGLAFTDVNDLARQIADTCEVETCFTQQLMSDALTSAHLPSALDAAEIAEIAQNFHRSGLDLQELVRAVVESDSFLRPE
jgi:hypothetical protein